jgi:hypothetical protein
MTPPGKLLATKDPPSMLYLYSKPIPGEAGTGVTFEIE